MSEGLHCPGCAGWIEPEYLRREPCPGALAHAAPEGLGRDAIAAAWEAVQHSDIRFPHRATIRAALAHAAPEGLDEVRANWPKHYNAAEAKAWIAAIDAVEGLSQPDATEEAGR